MTNRNQLVAASSTKTQDACIHRFLLMSHAPCIRRHPYPIASRVCSASSAAIGDYEQRLFGRLPNASMIESEEDRARFEQGFAMTGGVRPRH
jgi:hypothetical protein